MSVQEGALCIYVVEYDGCALTNPECGADGECSNNYGLAGTYNTCPNKCLYECAVQREVFTNCRIPHHIQQELGEYKYTVAVVGQPSHTPTKISFGDTFGRPATFTFCISGIEACNDPFSSTRIDRLIDAQKYWKGRRVIAYFGDCSMSLCEFERQVFIIDRVQGPSGKDGRYCIQSKDPLASIDGVKCPDGLPKKSVDGDDITLKLGLNLDGVATDDDPDADPYSKVQSFLFTQNLLDDKGRQATCLSQAKFLCVDGELLKVQPEINNTATSTGYNFRLLDRAQCGSTLKAHDSGSNVTVPLVFQPHEHVADVIKRIVQECADMTETFLLCCTDTEQVYIDDESFDDYRCRFPLQTLNDYVIICKPTSAKTILKSLAQTFLFGLYMQNGAITLKGFAPNLEEPEIVTQYQVLQYSENTTNTGEVATAVIYRYTVDDWTKTATGDNLIDTIGVVGEDFLREPCDRREYPQASVKEIETAWIGPENEYLGYTSAIRWRKILACPADEICLTLTLKESQRFPINQNALLRIDKNLDWRGEYKEQQWVAVSREIVQKGECVKVCFRESPFADEESCLSCDFQFPAATDDCDETCVSVW